MQSDAVEPLLRELDAQTTWVAEQLARIGDRRAAVPLLAKLTQSDQVSWISRQAVADALAQLDATPAGGAERAWYELARTKPDWKLVQSLGAAALEPLRWVASEGNPKHRGKATQMLARLSP